MSYTNTWSTTTPANTDSSAGAAADMRKIRLDIQERMETLLGTGNWATDPVTLIGSDALFLMYHWSDFNILSVTGGVTWSAAAGTQYGVTPNGATTTVFYCPMIIPRGVTITSIEVLGGTGASSTLTGVLEDLDATTGTVAVTTHATVAMLAGTTQTAKVSSTISVQVDSTLTNYKFYYLKLTLVAGAASAAWFQGIRVNYTRANISQTL